MAAPAVNVRLADGAESGFANIVAQFLEQNLADFQQLRRRASRLRGRIVMTASDHDAAVTLGFSGDGITIWDGRRQPVHASITGPYEVLVDLIQGESNPLREHLRGRIKVTSSFSRPFFPLRVHSLMKLPEEKRRGAVPWRPVMIGVAGAGALFFLMRAL